MYNVWLFRWDFVFFWLVGMWFVATATERGSILLCTDIYLIYFPVICARSTSTRNRRRYGMAVCVLVCLFVRWTHWSGQSRTFFARTQIRRKVDSPRSIHPKHEKSTRAISVCEWNTHHHHHDHRPQSTRESGVSTWIWANKIYRLTPRAANAKSVRNACGLGCIYDVHT